MNSEADELAQIIINDNGRRPFNIAEAVEWTKYYCGGPDDVGYQFFDNVVDGLIGAMVILPKHPPEPKPAAWGTWG